MFHFIVFLLSVVTSSPVPEAIPGEYIAVLKSASKRASFEKEITLKASKSFNIGDFQAYLYTNVSDSLLSDLRGHPSVKYVEGNGILHAIQGQDTQPNPPSWGLPRVSQRNLPTQNVYTYPSSAGEGVRVYVVDTGIYLEHNDLPNSVFGVTTNNNGGDEDCNGHGTHVAGTVGGTSYGVAKKATLVHVKVLGCSGSGSFAQVIAGIDWSVTDLASGGGLSTGVINLSLGGGSSQSVNDAVDAATAGGIISSVAAGNDYGRDACLVSPAGAPTAYTVAAGDSSDRPASFTNLGPCVNIWAPGVSITSAYIGSPTASRSLSGTSMSAPHVAGVAALILGENNGLTPHQVMTELTNTATPNVISGVPSGTVNLNLFNGATTKAASY